MRKSVKKSKQIKAVPAKLLHQTNEVLAESLCLPKDLVHGDSVISLTGSEEAWIENYKGIIEYTETIICLQLKHGKIVFEGTGLHIAFYTSEEMRLTGKIRNIHFMD